MPSAALASLSQMSARATPLQGRGASSAAGSEWLGPSWFLPRRSLAPHADSLGSWLVRLQGSSETRSLRKGMASDNADTCTFPSPSISPSSHRKNRPSWFHRRPEKKKTGLALTYKYYPPPEPVDLDVQRPNTAVLAPGNISLTEDLLRSPPPVTPRERAGRSQYRPARAGDSVPMSCIFFFLGAALREFPANGGRGFKHDYWRAPPARACRSRRENTSNRAAATEPPRRPLVGSPIASGARRADLVRSPGKRVLHPRCAPFLAVGPPRMAPWHFP